MISFDDAAFTDAVFIYVLFNDAALMVPIMMMLLPITWHLMALLSMMRLQILMTHVVDAAFVDAALMVPILTMLLLME